MAAQKSIFMIASPERGDSPRGGEMPAGQRGPLSTRGTAVRRWRGFFVKSFHDEFMERFAFYERAKKAYAVIATGETAIYANVLLKKGVVLPEETP